MDCGKQRKLNLQISIFVKLSSSYKRGQLILKNNKCQPLILMFLFVCMIAFISLVVIFLIHFYILHHIKTETVCVFKCLLT
jgi:hypothetical protein